MAISPIYIAIDLKSFYASVECVEREVNPLTTNLVVADESRTEKTICLAVSPSLKAYHIPGRARLFEVVEKVREVNAARRALAPNREFTGSSCMAQELEKNPSLELSYIVARPRMALYMKYSTQIYEIYLKYIAPEDIHVYSVDEVFMDVSSYLNTYKLTPRQLAEKMIADVFETTGITATAGIGTNLYLCKVAMDIVAKHIEPDENGVRIAELDEMTYRRLLWNHRPLTDFWRVGPGIRKKLEEYGMYTMGDVARCSLGGVQDLQNEELLYRLFGVNAELLIDHAWGYEPCTIAEIKAYKPSFNSVSIGQVLQSPYDFNQAKLIIREMTDLLVFDLVDKKLVTNRITLNIGYDVENLKDSSKKPYYQGKVTTDRYGRSVPKAAHGSESLDGYTSSAKKIMDAMMRLYDRIVAENLTVRRMNVVAEKVLPLENRPSESDDFQQMSLFSDPTAEKRDREKEKKEEEKERNLLEAMLSVKKKYGKNAILKGMNLQKGATTKERNEQIGGHKA